MTSPSFNPCRTFTSPIILATLLLLQTWMSAVLSVELNLFYPFGSQNGDRTLKAADDYSSEDVRVQESFHLYNNSYRNIYVNTNGHISFDSEFPAYRIDLAMPLGYHMVAPFFADIDTRGVGDVFYRNTSDQDVIQRAAADIQTYFSGFQNFMPTTLFIVTWYRVGYFEQKSDLTNTFQLVLASDGKDTFSLFHYLDNGINWQRSDGKFTPNYQDIPPQAGFDGGEGGTNYMLPGSGETASFVTGSNVNVPGVWMFQIGNIVEGNVRPADLNTGDITVFKPKAQGGCSQAAGVCHVNARCVENDDGFCCECVEPYYGNGYECLQPGTPQTLNSRMYGTLNGVALPENAFMHTYVSTVDGRTYSAFSQVPQSIAPAVQTLNSMSGVIGWLFALPVNPSAKNGYSLTGGKFNRTATVTYKSTDGSPDRVVRIQQSFFGHQATDKLRMETRLEGNLPEVPEGALVSIDDFTESYTKSQKGVIKSYAQRTYRVNNIASRYTWDNTINFDECDGGETQTPTTMRLSVGKHFVRHNAQEQVVRFVMTSKVGIAGGVDACTSLGLQCHRHADCISRGDSFQCVCGSGYQGNGVDCEDVNECLQNVCDVNARCQNYPGSFRCQCNPGYTGNGRTCQPEGNMCGEKQCDENARCTFDPSSNTHSCECRPGFRMDRDRCVQEGDCRRGGVCGANAECVFDDILREYTCECLDEFSGDGYSCEAVDPGCNACDRNAECVQNTFTNKQTCQCGPGYTGDGYQCDQIDTCARCDNNAQCVYDDRRNAHVCVCVRGYRGNGEQCYEADCRNETGLCAEEGGLCWLNPATNKAICRCNFGYRGDGFRCQKVGCDVYNDCDRNAKCVEEGSQYICKCMEGFFGTGRRCRPDGPTTCDVYNDCDRNARCTPDQNDPPVYSCRCIPGYKGDGKRCEPTDEDEFTCTSYNDCDRNARCVPVRMGNDSAKYVCQCNPGFSGNGKRCEGGDVTPRPNEYTCTSYNDCDRNAKCVPVRGADDSTQYVCQCNPGFSGNGKRCEGGDVTPRPNEYACTDYNDCDRNARCVPQSANSTSFICRCNPGFRGDGKRCQQVTETSCNQVNNCDKNAACVYNPDAQSYRCVCNRGYEGDGTRCRRKEVIDCRRDPRLCSTNAECRQGAGEEYVCVCKSGYRGDGATCSYVVMEGESLIYAQGSKLMRISLDPKPGDNGQQIAYLQGQMAVGIDIDCKEGNIYWTDVAHGVIRRSNMAGENMETVLNGLKSPEGIAIDFSARNMFFTDSELDVVQVAKLDGSSVKTLVSTDMVNPRAIVLDISRGVVFWTDWNRDKPQIERINMDGTDRRIVVYNDLRLPNGLAYDSYSQLLCWGDAGNKKIECVRSDGTGRRVVHDAATYPFDITMLNNNIYWSDWKKRNIPNVNVNSGTLNNPLTLAAGGHGRLYGITAVRDQCPRERNSCGLNNGGCSYLCLASPNGGRTCGCPDGTDPRLC